jgi:hypothetical protein
VVGRIREDFPGSPTNVLTSYVLDADGRHLSETVSCLGLSLTRTNIYDALGRLTKSIDPVGLVTERFYSQDGRTTTDLQPGGATVVTTTYLDGRARTVSGSGTIARTYEYGVLADGTQWTCVYTGPGGTNSPILQ